MSKLDNSGQTEPKHPISVVARRTGIPLDVLRAWERRYQAVVPSRSPTGRRLYTDMDVARLQLMKRIVDGGRRISDVAALGLADLTELAHEDEAALAAAPQPRRPLQNWGGSDADAEELLAELIAAVEELDRRRLERALAGASVALSGPRLRGQVIVPLLQAIGDRWREGSLRVIHEHLASAVVRSYLGTLRGSPSRPGAPRIIVTTPAGQIHELGALLAAAAAGEEGWEVSYLGPNLPAEEIAAAVRQEAARAVALSIVHPARDPLLGEELRRLRALLGPGYPLLVGGQAAASYGAVLEEIGAQPVGDLSELPLRLRKLLS